MAASILILLGPDFAQAASPCVLRLAIVEGGSVPEWLMGADCKSAGYAYAGSNPARPTTQPAHVAQG